MERPLGGGNPGFRMAVVTSPLRFIWQFVLIAHTWQYLDQSGREFVLPFPVIPSTTQDGEIILYVRGPEFASVTVRVPGKVPTTHTLSSSATKIQITQPETVAYSGSAVLETKGVLVESPSDFTLHVIRGYFTEGFLAIPKTPWSTEFYVLSYDPSPGGVSYFTIAAYDSATQVEVFFKNEGIGDCASIPAPGVPLYVTLQKQMVWGIHCDQMDLTGTHIRSSRPISVVSGAIIPFRDGNYVDLVFMEEMMIPVVFFGSNFVLPTVSGTSSILRIVASANDTIIYNDGAVHTYMNAGDYYDISTAHSLSMCINGTRPFQVALLGQDAASSYSSEDGILGIIYMVIVPPVERFKKSYEVEVFFQPFGFLFSSHLIFLLENIYVDQIGDGFQWENDTFSESSSCCKYAAVYLLDADTQAGNKFFISKNFSFGVMQISTTFSNGWGHLERISLDPPSCPVSDGYTYLGSSHTCIHDHTGQVSWDEAQSLCESQRSTLVKLNSDQLIQTVETLLAPLLENGSFWIGLKKNQGTEFIWTDGELISVSDWVSGQPDDNASCVFLNKSFGAIGWLGSDCATAMGYICQMTLADTVNINLFTDVCNVDTDCPVTSGYVYLGNSGICIKKADTPLSWTDANAACLASGDRLLTLDTDIKNVEIQVFIKHGWSKFYIGASWHNSTNASWVWSDCSPLDFDYWVNGAPVNRDTQCVAVNTTDPYNNGTWHGVSCGETLFFICEKRLTSSTSLRQVTGPNDGTCDEVRTSSTYLSSIAATPAETPSVGLTFTPSLLNKTDATSSIVNELPTSFESFISISLTSTETLDIVELTSESPTLHDSSEYLDTSTLTDRQLSNLLQSSTEIVFSMSEDLVTASAPSRGQSSNSVTSLNKIMTEGVFVPSTTFYYPFSNTLQSSMDDTSSMWTYEHTTLYTNYIKQMAFSSSNMAITTVQTPYLLVNKVCRCTCIPKNRLENLSPDAVSSKDSSIRKELLLDTKTLTKTIAKYTSAKDDRPTASGIGLLGIFLLAFTAFIIFGSDIISVMRSRSQRSKVTQNKQ